MMILISGGSGSGKSALGEELLSKCVGYPKIYIATMKPFGEEAHNRILRHQDMRKNKGFSTMEVYQDLESIALNGECDILLECMSNLLSNEMFCKNPNSDLVSKIIKGVEHLRDNCKNLVVISNEIFSDGCNYDKSIVEYIKTLGIINQRVAELSDIVVECVYGNPVVYKGDLSWFG